MNAVQDFVNKHHDSFIKFGGLFALIFLAVFSPGYMYSKMNQVIQDQQQAEINLKNQIDDLNSQVGFYKQSYQKRVFIQKETQCLAKNIYYEIGTKSVEGMQAIAQVTLNRKREGFADTICGVVYQRSGSICQFSWVCKNPEPPEPEAYKKAYEVAQTSIIRGYALMILKNALYFHADYISPSWKAEKAFVAQIGPHLFYSER